MDTQLAWLSKPHRIFFPNQLKPGKGCFVGIFVRSTSSLKHSMSVVEDGTLLIFMQPSLKFKVTLIKKVILFSDIYAKTFTLLQSTSDLAHSPPRIGTKSYSFSYSHLGFWGHSSQKGHRSVSRGFLHYHLGLSRSWAICRLSSRVQTALEMSLKKTQFSKSP